MDEDLLSSDTDCRGTSTCYFFFKDDNASQQSGANALCAILHQLFVQKPALLTYALTEFRNHGEHIRNMFSILWSILEKAVSCPEAGRIICVLDALDECSGLVREDLIARLSRFYRNRDQLNAKMKFLVTSRPYYDIERAFRNNISDMTSINLKGEDETESIRTEIDLVIDHTIPQISKNRRYPLRPEVHDALIKQLKSIPHRTYLWLHLILNVIQKSLDSTKTSLERLIHKIPHTVEDAYEKILARINGSDLARQARTLLHIIVAAERPLSILELNIALAVEDKLYRGEAYQSFEDLDVQPEGPFRERIRNCCGLFVSIIDSKVYLLHQTAKEFLVSERVGDISKPNVWQHSLKPAESNSILVKVCISYLLLEEFEGEVEVRNEPLNHHPPDDWVFERMADAFKVDAGVPRLEGLLSYAGRHWPSHFRKAEYTANDSIVFSALKICDTRSNRFWKWSPAYSLYFSRVYLKRNKNFSNLLVASYCGLDALVKLILEKDVIELKSRDHQGDTPLLLAAHRGFSKVIELLLKRMKDDVDLNAKNQRGATALWLAVQSGQSNVVKLLIERDGIDLNTQDTRLEKTPLILATSKGNSKVVKLMLAVEGVELNSVDFGGSSALVVAAEKGHLEVTKLLLEKKGVDRNLEDGSGMTPLATAASEGHLNIVKLLISQTDVDLNAQNCMLQTPLTLALFNRRSEIAKLLLSTDGVDFNWRDCRGDTPLTLDASTGKSDAVELLLKKDGIELNARTDYDESALSQAAENGNPEIVRLLLERGAELNVQDRRGRTPLMLAEKRGHDEVVNLVQEFSSLGVGKRSADITKKTCHQQNVVE